MNLKNKFKRIILVFITKINKILYPSYDVDNSVHSQITILKCGIWQKIFRFNSHVYWPVHRSSTIGAPHNITIGTRTPGLSKNCHIDGRNRIFFGKNVWVGPNVKIISMNHNVNDYTKYIKAKPIKIGNNCWIGANAIILPEVELGEHTVVAAGAIVTKSFLEGNQIIAGNPAKVVKKITVYGATNE